MLGHGCYFLATSAARFWIPPSWVSSGRKSSRVLDKHVWWILAEWYLTTFPGKSNYWWIVWPRSAALVCLRLCCFCGLKKIPDGGSRNISNESLVSSYWPRPNSPVYYQFNNTNFLEYMEPTCHGTLAMVSSTWLIRSSAVTLATKTLPAISGPVVIVTVYTSSLDQSVTTSNRRFYSNETNIHANSFFLWKFLKICHSIQFSELLLFLLFC